MPKPKPKSPAKKLGQPPVPINMDQLAVLMRYKPTQNDCAAFFKCCADTIERRIREHTGLTYAEYRDQHFVHTRFSLIQNAIKRGLAGDNAMHIFSLKNLCNWSDKVPGEENKTIVLSGNIQVERAELDDRIKLIKEKK